MSREQLKMYLVGREGAVIEVHVTTQKNHHYVA